VVTAQHSGPFCESGIASSVELTRERSAEDMKATPITLDGHHVQLRPLLLSDKELLVAAANDGELWRSSVTVVPTYATIDSYIGAALDAQERGSEIPFVIVRKGSDQIVGSTRYYGIEQMHRRLEIGYTWLAASAQRTPVNTEAKLLLLTHAFEALRAVRVGFITDVLNLESRTAILRIGAKEEGILRNHMIMPDGRCRDSVFYGITCSEWPEIKAALAAKLELLTRKTSN
jgi:N-acetyltransferase